MVVNASARRELLAALRSVREGGQDLEIAIGQHLGLIDADRIYTSPDGSRSGRGNCDPWPSWTRSTDAAWNLVDRLFPPVAVSVAGNRASGYVAQIQSADGRRAGVRQAFSSPALALCAAIVDADWVAGR